MAVEIQPLKQQNGNPIKNWGLNGYASTQIWEVAAQAEAGAFVFALKPVDKPYQKCWEPTTADLERYQELIGQGDSFGAYENGELVGWVIGERRAWNNSFYIEHIMVSEKLRGQGIGQQLLQKAIAHSKSLHCRIVALETQNTNAPAIEFYLKQGFGISGIHLKLYDAPAENEVAIFMNYEH